ncbi:hypothetical protein [uncultured Wocania sp.]|uniref:hypothetical protein n=1 Tax=uncultured Wocania sp. TaxID=2834404 RepID=UPI0030F88D21
MLLNYKSLTLPCILLINQIDVVTVLIIVVVIFSFLLILGVRKSYLLKKENERLNSMNTTIEDENEKPYKDFTDGHMYGK